ncbi:class I SAM-dependent RNA methyltransferase [Stappia indica]|uniref:RNA methyltransferase n=1 Tax=Stappia indica TaxID=538381 RepID=A0A857CD08_9HYPH|nr:class I SAM-dependent RNA methyltransferase [Stappia indica]QGZ36352.1 RNA methyltransferase [Stappia indica]
MTQDATLDIIALAHKGEGRADTPDGPVHVPFTLPGETVRVRREGTRARLLEVLTSSPDRVEPACPHFGTCGGCALQHMDQAPILDWKRQQVVAAFAARGLEGLEPLVEPTVDAGGRGRRRAVFAATRGGARILLGFHERSSHRLVDVSRCPVLVPEIVELLPVLKALAARVMPRKGEVTLTVLATPAGADLALASPAKIEPRATAGLIEEAMAAGIARLSLNGEVLVEARAPAIDMGGIPLIPPPGAFVQATEAGEEALAARVLAGVGKARKVADLFCGSGTFALRLARKATVRAVEGEASALAALDRAMRAGAGALREIRAERRDLFRNPLTAVELDDYGRGMEAVVFDPPRAGAEAQAKELARSKVPTVVAVSCNPGTLARDLRILVDGGYRISSVLPVDQFRFSPHIEVVAVLSRG